MYIFASFVDVCICLWWLAFIIIGHINMSMVLKGLIKRL